MKYNLTFLQIEQITEKCDPESNECINEIESLVLSNESHVEMDVDSEVNNQTLDEHSNLECSTSNEIKEVLKIPGEMTFPSLK